MRKEAFPNAEKSKGNSREGPADNLRNLGHFKIFNDFQREVDYLNTIMITEDIKIAKFIHRHC
jgi:hypothetical protein